MFNFQSAKQIKNIFLKSTGYLIFHGMIMTSHAQDSDLGIVFNRINQEVMQNSQAYQNLEKATREIGHRLTGTENGRKAEERAAEIFRSAGFDNILYSEFSFQSWQRESARLEITVLSQHKRSKQHLTVETVSLANTPVKSFIKGDLMDAGNGLKSDFERVGSGLRNKIALINIGLIGADRGTKNLHRSEKAALAIQAGVKGIVFINTVEGRILLTGTASVTGELIPVPALCVTFEDGNMMRDAIADKGKIKVNIEVRNKSHNVSARNVSAVLTGSSLSDDKIIIGGHLDSWDLASGAIDNGIGTFAILDIARTMKALGLQPKRSIEFVMFMGEEQGLHGSRAFVKQANQSGGSDNIKYMINLDMSGNPVGFNGFGRNEMESFFKQTGHQINQIDTTFRNTYRSEVSLHSDHQEFIMEGIPVLGLNSNLEREIYRFYHSNKDNFNLVNEAHLKNTVRFTAMLLFALADADAIYAKRMTSEQTRDFLEKHNLKEELVIGQDWRW
jgi:carboxypeptidase Q